ncbi:DUF2235 domain-containing protein [Mycolicibacterium flavescens]|uniref:T6SS Phospholipase effector Tle1-like catalytic domain-containing protein n=1 Tax=Mycolicibacterium flavescens TaxID=1776 RepID=A0A1E3RLT4_MYCFV|nr:DUF2235 domain-containing protein [Mycolicibacterium flavescens]MCV7281810.1 DUF2235 domain-containing protein [Mycolicibacterium flavescens]ODQ90808.1 hypothetical protein BHQ18_08765 [Mycolicibacterium flavescens]
MKKLVLCFDRARRHPTPGDATNAHRLFHLLDDRKDQLTWYHPGVGTHPLTRLNWRETAADDARAAIAEAYQFLVDRWEPGDRIYMFGVGRGAYCAQTLTRLLNIVGVLPDLMDYALAAYTLPRTVRTAQDWARVREVTSELLEQRGVGIPVWFLGLWDSMTIPGFTRRSLPAPLSNVEIGRHAVAIDGRPGVKLVGSASERIDEVWFRGAHCDIAGGRGACAPLAEITFDWMLDGAVAAGLAIPAARRTSATGQLAALTETPPTIALRRLPDTAAVHGSVEPYLREHPQYWKRLPGEVTWSDLDWAARAERNCASQPGQQQRRTEPGERHRAASLRMTVD